MHKESIFGQYFAIFGSLRLWNEKSPVRLTRTPELVGAIWRNLLGI